jgi:hypothetical protein
VKPARDGRDGHTHYPGAAAPSRADDRGGRAQRRSNGKRYRCPLIVIVGLNNLLKNAQGEYATTTSTRAIAGCWSITLVPREVNSKSLRMMACGSAPPSIARTSCHQQVRERIHDYRSPDVDAFHSRSLRIVFPRTQDVQDSITGQECVENEIHERSGMHIDRIVGSSSANQLPSTISTITLLLPKARLGAPRLAYSSRGKWGHRGAQ